MPTSPWADGYSGLMDLIHKSLAPRTWRTYLQAWHTWLVFKQKDRVEGKRGSSARIISFLQAQKAAGGWGHDGRTVVF
ncbi:hypothetical protein FKM82_019151 [Ascaphus truei]